MKTQYLLLGGHADGRRSDMYPQQLPDSIWVPSYADMITLTGPLDRAPTVREQYRHVKTPAGSIFVHESITDAEVLTLLIEKYPAEPILSNLKRT